MPLFLRLILPFVFIFASVGTWRLYIKAGQAGWKIFVPIVNLVAFMKIIGRPATHIWYLLIPGFNIYFMYKILTELCISFGKGTTTDYVLICIFNVLYILNLGLAYDCEYHGPAYKMGSIVQPESEQQGNMAQFA